MLANRTACVAADILDFGTTARGLISCTATGLTYTDSTGVLSLTTGYVIPTTANESNWNVAYGVVHNSKSPNTFLGGPQNGNAAEPSFRAVALDDLPTISVAKGGTNLNTIANGSVLATNATDTLVAVSSVSGLKVLVNTDGVVAWGSSSGTGSILFSASPTLVTPTLGAASATSINKVGITTPATGATVTLADGITFTVNTALTFTGGAWTIQFLASGRAYSEGCGAAGAPAAVADGGTGKTAWTQYCLVYASGTTTLAQLATGTSGQPLLSGGGGAAPAWATWTAPTTMPAGSVLAANAANTLSAVTSTSGTYVLQNFNGIVSWASYLPAITANTTLYVATTGNDTTGTGAVGAPWATITKALAYLNGYWITPGVSVVISVGAGTYAHTSAIEVTHPCAKQIYIYGAYTAGDHAKTMSSVVSSSGTTGAWSLTFQLNDVTNIANGDYVCVTAASGGTGPTWAMGAHLVTNVDSGNARITVTSVHTHTVPPSGSVAATVKVLKTIITFSGCQGFMISNGVYLGVLGYLAIVKASDKNGIRVTNRGGCGCLAPMAVIGTAATDTVEGIYAGDMGYVSATGICVSGCGVGIAASWQSMVFGSNMVISGAPTNGKGLSADNSSMLSCYAATITGCGKTTGWAMGIYAGSGSIVYAHSVVVTANLYGIYAFGLSFVYASFVSASDNTADYSPAADTEGNTLSFIDV